MDTDDPARYRTIPLVRLPSIDHGLAPFPEGMLQMLPLRRGSLTDPLVHAHIPAAASQHLQHHHQQQHQLQGARQLFPEYNDEQRLSAGYPNQPYWAASASSSSPSNGPGSSLFPVQESSIDARYSDTQHNRRPSASSGDPYNQKQATFPVQHGTKRKTLDASQTEEGDAHYYSTTSIPYAQQGSANANSAFFPEQQQQQQQQQVPGEAALKKRASIASVESGEVAGRLGKTAKELQQHITSNAVKLDETNIINSRLQDRRDSATSSTNGSAFQRVNQQQPSYAFPLSSQHQHEPSATRSPPPVAPNLATYTFGRPSPSPAASGVVENYLPQQQQNVPHVSLSEPHHSSPENGHARIPSVLSTEAQSRASTIFGGGMNGSNNMQTDQRGPGGEEDDDDTASGGGGGGIEGSMGRLKPPSHVAYTKETPYSRSPELKISHKMAERKRRKEMKELFDDLRDSIPTERGLKSSKWEVLSKAIEYIAKLMEEKESDYRITQDLKVHINSLENALSLARQQVHSLQQQQQQQQQQQAMSSASPVSMHAGPPQPPANLFPHPTAPLPSQSHSNWTPSPSPLGSTFSGHHQSSLPPSFHHRSQSHGQLSHPHGHTASSAPPAIYHSHSHPGTFPDHHSSGHNSHNHSYQSSSAGGATATRPPSIHSHNSNHSIHSVHSMHSNQGIGSPGPGPASGSGHGGPHLLSPSPTNPSLLLQQQNLASVQEDYQLFAHAPPAGQQQQQSMQHIQQQQQLGGPNGHMAY